MPAHMINIHRVVNPDISEMIQHLVIILQASPGKGRDVWTNSGTDTPLPTLNDLFAGSNCYSSLSRMELTGIN